VGTAHELKPTSEPLLAPVEWCSASFVMTTIITDKMVVSDKEMAVAEI